MINDAGLVAADVVLVDGQGADPASAPPGQMVSYLRWTQTQPRGATLKAGQPVLGQSGTLAGNDVTSPAKGHVQAKTGTSAHGDTATGRVMFNVQRLAGFMTAPDGRELVFDVAMSSGTYQDVPTGVGQASKDVSGVVAAFQQSLSYPPASPRAATRRLLCSTSGSRPHECVHEERLRRGSSRRVVRRSLAASRGCPDLRCRWWESRTCRRDAQAGRSSRQASGDRGARSSTSPSGSAWRRGLVPAARGATSGRRHLRGRTRQEISLGRSRRSGAPPVRQVARCSDTRWLSRQVANDGQHAAVVVVTRR